MLNSRASKINTTGRVAAALSIILSTAFGVTICGAVSAEKKTNVELARTSNKPLPKTQKLINNDNLIPTQNRTQAMRLEAETGSINPSEDAALRPKPKPILTRQVKRSGIHTSRRMSAAPGRHVRVEPVH